MVKDGKEYLEIAAGVVSIRKPVNGLFACPYCLELSFAEAGGYEICDNCGWEDDPVQESNPNLAGGANRTSLSEAREHFKRFGWSEEKQTMPNLPD
jgi:hypothetical protein